MQSDISLEKAISREQLRLLVSSIPAAIFSNLTLGSILVLVQKAVIPSQEIMVWMGMLIAVSVFRFGVYIAHRRNPGRDWKKWFDVGVLCTGLTWAAASVLLFPPGQVVYQLFLGVVIAGVTVGAVASLSPSIFSLALFTLPACLAISIQLLREGTGVPTGFAIMAVLFCATIIASARRIYQNTAQNIQLRLQDKAQQARLEESRQQLRLIVENVGDALFVHDINGRILDVNPYACSCLGYTREELLNMTVFDVELDASTDAIEIGWQEQVLGEPVRLSGHHRRKDGSVFPVDVSLCKYLQNEVPVFLAVVRDMSVSRRYEEALKANEEKFRAQFRAIPVPTYTWQKQDGDFALIDANDAALEYTGGSIKEYFGIRASKLHRDDPHILAALKRCMETGSSHSLETSYVIGAKSNRIMEVKFAYVPPDLVMVHSEDITERRQSELALRASREQLKQAQRVARMGYWTMDKTTAEVQWSDEMYELLGLKPGEQEASTELFLSFVHPDDVQVLMRNMEMLFTKDVCPEMEVRIRHTDGSLHTLLSTVKALTGDDGSITYLGTLHDITEAKLQQQLLIDAKEEADKANRAKSEFLSRMSHELRTPMNAILGFAQLFDMDKTITDEQKQNISEIYRAGEHLLGLINEVLDLARIESGRMEINIEDVSVDSILDECETLIYPLATKRAIRIRRHDVNFADEPVLADRTRLKQVILNLMSNAVKYNRQGGQIVIGCEIIDGERVKISVADTGEGIPLEKQKSLFLPFQRLGAENSEIEGTGIGLVIARKLVELMGGGIEVESETGVGSVFSIQLPLSMERSMEEETKIRRKLPLESNLLTESWFKILYIEDNPASLRLVENILSRYPGVQLLSAPEPFLGIELAQAHQPDLILLDINLPGMDGFRVLRKLQEDSATMEIPVVAITANVSPRNIEHGRKAGFFEYLTKPVEVGLLMRTIEKVLSVKAAGKDYIFTEDSNRPARKH